MKIVIEYNDDASFAVIYKIDNKEDAEHQAVVTAPLRIDLLERLLDYMKRFEEE